MQKLNLNTFDGLSSLNAGTKLPNGKSLAEILNEVIASANILKFVSAASAGGAANEALVVTGLKAGDEILAVFQKTDGANSLPLLGYSTVAANAITGMWSADPGAGAVVEVTVRRPL